MTAEQFSYWMQGFAELTGDEPPTPAQWKSIKEHLATVFAKVTPKLDYSKIGREAGVPPKPSDWAIGISPSIAQQRVPMRAECLAAGSDTV